MKISSKRSSGFSTLLWTYNTTCSTLCFFLACFWFVTSVKMLGVGGTSEEKGRRLERSYFILMKCHSRPWRGSTKRNNVATLYGFQGKWGRIYDTRYCEWVGGGGGWKNIDMIWRCHSENLMKSGVQLITKLQTRFHGPSTANHLRKLAKYQTKKN